MVDWERGFRSNAIGSAVFFIVASLCLLWFAAALSTALSDAGQGVWATAATAASASLGVAVFVLITLSAPERTAMPVSSGVRP